MHFLFVFLVQVREGIHFWFSSWICDPFCFYVCGYLLDSFTITYWCSGRGNGSFGEEMGCMLVNVDVGYVCVFICMHWLSMDNSDLVLARVIELT
jgi:hypothetical protein